MKTMQAILSIVITAIVIARNAALDSYIAAWTKDPEDKNLWGSFSWACVCSADGVADCRGHYRRLSSGGHDRFDKLAAFSLVDGRCLVQYFISKPLLIL